MKRLITVAVLTFLLAGTSFGLSDSEYIRLKNANSDFARADRNLNRVWKKVTANMPDYYFRILQDDQMEWIAGGWDDDAERCMDKGYSRAEAYTMATNDRAGYLPRLARKIMKR